MKMKTIIASLLMLFVGLMNASAYDWSVEYTGGKFVITRSNSTTAVTVDYRTVSISALEGKHFIGANGRLTFDVGESSKQVSVAEKSISDVELRYKYQCTYKLYYEFQVVDLDGDLLTRMTKTISYGGDNNNPYYLKGYYDYVEQGAPSNYLCFSGGSVYSSVSKYHDEPYSPPSSDVTSSGVYQGYALIDDSYDYKYKAATCYPDYLFAVNRAGATGGWHKLIGNKLYAGVVFTEKEKDDGYAYVQVLIGDSNTAYDEGYDPDGTVNDPVKSIYKACFELQKGSGTYSGSGKWIFPHVYDYVDKAAENSSDGTTGFWLDQSYLWKQKYRDASYKASGKNNNAFVLDPDVSALTVRFDCGGSNDDTFGYKDLFVRWTLIDNTPPTVIKSDIAVSPGLHAKGNLVTISIPFSEPVRLAGEDRYILHTSWGGLVAYTSCDYSNVVSFYGTITADEGTALTIDSIETTYNPNYGSSAPIIPIKDIVGNAFGGDVSKNLSDLKVDAFYTISYYLGGGVVAGGNPGKYNTSSDSFTLVNPTRENYVFTGWTGTGLDEPTMTVTIPSGSTGNRSYTATWAPEIDGFWTGEGTVANPYVISTPEGLNRLAFFLNEGITYYEVRFELGADIDMSSLSPFRGIGTSSNPFQGRFDGKGHVVSNLTVNDDGKDYSGLFRYIRNSWVTNVVVKNATINGKKGVAAVVGAAEDGSYGSQVNGCSAINCIISASYNANNFVGGVAGYLDTSTITNCIADGCTVSGSSDARIYIGGVSGYQKYTTNYSNIAANCNVSGVAGDIAYVGAVSGFHYACTINNSFALNTTTNGTEIILGGREGNLAPSGNHYHNVTCSDAAPVSDVFTITSAPEILASGNPTIAYAGTNYYSPSAAITLSPALYYTLDNAVYTPAGGVETATTDNQDGTFSFSMPAADVTVAAVSSATPAPANEATVGGQTRYCYTFYSATTSYELEPGAQAFTMKSDKALYAIGDGRIVPAGTAVIIMTTKADVAMTATLSTATPESGNILQGTSEATSVESLSIPDGKKVYVMGQVSGNFGFFEYTGSTIPANKAYYVE